MIIGNHVSRVCRRRKHRDVKRRQTIHVASRRQGAETDQQRHGFVLATHGSLRDAVVGYE